MYFGLDDENNSVTEKEAIIQINNVSEDKNYVNVCLKKSKRLLLQFIHSDNAI